MGIGDYTMSIQFILECFDHSVNTYAKLIYPHLSSKLLYPCYVVDPKIFLRFPVTN